MTGCAPTEYITLTKPTVTENTVVVSNLCCGKQSWGNCCFDGAACSGLFSEANLLLSESVYTDIGFKIKPPIVQLNKITRIYVLADDKNIPYFFDYQEINGQSVIQVRDENGFVTNPVFPPGSSVTLHIVGH